MTLMQTLQQRVFVVCCCVLVLTHVFLLPMFPATLRAIAALVLLILPGALLALRLFNHPAERDFTTRLFLVLCGGIAVSPLLLYALHLVPGALAWWAFLIPLNALSLLLAVQLARRPQTPAAHSEHEGLTIWMGVALVCVLAFATALRFVFLGQSEFQGDEARAVLKAAGVVHGQDEILFVHKKGPLEILLPAGMLLLTGQLYEWSSRLQFAVAGVGVVLGCFVLARHFLRSSVGILAGLIAASVIALDGLSLGFARIVQYQSVLVLLTLGALWCCWRFYEGATHPQRYLLSAAALMSVALLAHYDAVMMVPVLAWLVIAGMWRRRWGPIRVLSHLVLPVGGALAVLASFYVPFVLNERFARTAGYLSGRVGYENLSSSLFNHLRDHYYSLATLYSTTFQVHWLASILVAGVLTWLLWYGRPRALGWALAGLLLIGCGLLVYAPERLVLESGLTWAPLAFGLPLAGLALSPAMPMALRTVIIAFSVPFFAESFLIGDPETHFYTMHAPAALLIGIVVAQFVHWLKDQKLQWLAMPIALGGMALVLLAVPYLYIVFVRPSPSYLLTFPEARPDLYRASYGDALPKVGKFGFPHQSGWKTISDLYAQGILDGTYDSNEEQLITGWYTRGAFRCHIYPDYYFVSHAPRDSINIPLEVIQTQYHALGSVQIDEQETIDIYSRTPFPDEPQSFSLTESESVANEQTITNFAIARTLIETVPQYHLDTYWDRQVLLRGFDLDRHEITTGETMRLMFYWQTKTALEPEYELRVELINRDGETAGSITPLCGEVPPHQWYTHRTSGPAFTITADEDMPPGEYTLWVGLQHMGTGDYLPLVDGTPQLSLGTITVAGP